MINCDFIIHIEDEPGQSVSGIEMSLDSLCSLCGLAKTISEFSDIVTRIVYRKEGEYEGCIEYERGKICFEEEHDIIKDPRCR